MRLESGQSLWLHEQEQAWLQDGQLDIYLVSDSPNGAERQFLASLAAPAWLPGREELAGLDVRIEGTAPVTASLGEGPNRIDAAALSIDRWFDALGRAAQDLSGQPIVATRFLAAGEDAVAEAGQAIGARDAAAWCRWPAPPALCGVALAATQAMLPVTPRLVLTVQETAAVAPIATADLLRAGGQDVAAATRLLLDVLQALTLRRRSERLARTTSRWQAMETSFQASLGDFARLLEGRFKRGPTITQPLPAVIRAALPIAHEILGKAPPEFSPGHDEATVDVLARFAAVCGLRLRRVRLEGDWHVAPTGALIAFLPNDGGAPAPVTLLPGRFGVYEIEDPDRLQRRRRLTAEVVATVAPIAYALQPTLPAGKLTYREILLFGLRHARWNIAELAILGTLVSALGMMIPFAYSMVAGHVIPTRDLGLLIALVGALLAAVATEMVLRIASAVVALRMDGRVGILLHGAMIDRALRLPARALRSSTPVILATQLETVERFRRAFTSYVVAATVALMSGLMATVLIMFYVPEAGLIMLLCTAALLVTVATIGWRQFHAIYEGERMDVIVLAFVYELIRLVPTLRAFGVERLAFVQWAQNFLAFQSRLLRSARITASASVIEAGWELPTLAIGFFLLATHVHDGVTIAAAVAFVVALGKLMAAGRELAHISMGIAKLMPMAKLARSFIEHELEPVGALLPMSRLRGEIELQNVGFSYGSTPVLSAISLRIGAGEHVAIVGPSGSGKTTLLRLMLGLERPGSGRIYIDGQDLALHDARLIRRQVGAVMQFGVLFPGTILENIRAATELSLDEAWEAARLADIAADIEAMPMGMHTRVAEGTGSLSGGQTQRLLLARALAARPAIMVLDEAMSALDNRSQAIIVEAVSNLVPTRVTVSHRFSTLARCDRIFVLDRGQLVDQGTFDELASRDGLFRDLLKRQVAQVDGTA